MCRHQIFVASAFVVLLSAAGALGARHRVALPVASVSEELLARCALRWHNTYLDHFSRVRASISPDEGSTEGDPSARCLPVSFHVFNSAATKHSVRAQSTGPNGEETFPLRYYVCDDKFQRANATHAAGPIFFYLGNEADVGFPPTSLLPVATSL
jgi:hypothetical protein